MAIKQPQTSSSKSPPEETYTACSISKTEESALVFSSRMFTPGSSSVHLIFGGTGRMLGETKCAFFLSDADSINNPDRCFSLTPADFARVNPNTGTAPVFRTQRDADITRRIYENHPVLVDRSGREEIRAWPVKYMRMIDMTNDSDLFRTAEQLTIEGFLQFKAIVGNEERRLYAPLYEGKMVRRMTTVPLASLSIRKT